VRVDAIVELITDIEQVCEVEKSFILP
jgi:hypothetical protein